MAVPSLSSCSVTPRTRCIVAHLILVIIHLTLLIWWIVAWKSQKQWILNNIPPDRVGMISVIVAVALQAFATVYMAVVLVLTQQVVFSNLAEPDRSLTAIHDVASSWNGIGSALLSLWRQKSIPASRSETFLITLYLFCISVIHITTTTLMSTQIDTWAEPGEYAVMLYLNPLQVVIGFAMSIILLGLAIIFTKPRKKAAPVRSFGVLELLWLLRNQPQLLEGVAEVDDPTVEHLRSAGIALRFQVMGEGEVKSNGPFDGKSFWDDERTALV